MRSINAYNHHVSQALWLSMPLIKSSVSIIQQSKGIYSLSKQLTSNSDLLNKFVNHACQDTYTFKQRRTFVILYFNVLWNVHVQMGSYYPIQPGLHILLSGWNNSQGNDICSSSLRVFPLAVCLSLMYCNTDWYACQFWHCSESTFGSVSSFCRSFLAFTWERG